MRKLILSTLLAGVAMGAVPSQAQVKMTREQMLFYTADWKGDRFPDGRPKVADSLLTRATKGQGIIRPNALFRRRPNERSNAKPNL